MDTRVRLVGSERGSAGHRARRARRRDQLHRHRAGVRRGRRGRDVPARPPRRPRRHRAHHQGAATTSPPNASSRASRNVRTTGSRRRSGSSARTRCGGSASTTSTSTSCTTRGSSRSSPTTCGRRSSTSRTEGKVRELGVALGPAIGWVEEGTRADRRSPDRVAADGVQRARAGARAHVRGAPARAERGSQPDLARAARVGHALGQGDARHRLRPEGPPLAPQPRQHARQLREGRDAQLPVGTGDRPHDRPGRDRGASSPTSRSPRCCRRVLTVDEVREYAEASDLPLTESEYTDVERCGRATSTTRTATSCR